MKIKIILKWALYSLIRNSRRSILTVIIMVFGLTAIIFFLGLKRGVYSRMIENSTSFYISDFQINSIFNKFRPEIRIAEPEILKNKIEGSDNSVKCAYRISEPAILQFDTSSRAITLIGLSTDNEKKVSKIMNSVTELDKNLFDYSVSDDSGCAGIIIGKSMKDYYKTKIGSVSNIIIKINGKTKNLKIRIAGFYSAPMNRFDELFVIMNYSNLSKITERNTADEFSISCKNSNKKQVFSSISKIISRDYKLTEWSDLFPDITKLIELNDAAMFVVSIIIYTLVFIAIINTMLMSFYDKLKNFGMLICYGISQFTLLMIILTESLILFIFSSFCGTASALVLISYFNSNGIDLSKFLSDNPYFMMDMRIFTEMPRSELIYCYSGLLAASLGAAVIAGRKLFKTDILDLLHF
ncbi:ABC transporter permease [Candidatus Dependentiae bacterium]|nr:ABC transporter permease [Candidatus Dependentiae bacterium]